MSKKKEAIEKKSVTEIEVLDYGEDAGTGYEQVTQDDMQVPFLSLLQGISDTVMESDGALNAGQWYNTVTEESYDKEKGFLFVPATTKHQFVEWTPRGEGGGGATFVDNHVPASQVVQKAIAESEFGKYKTDAGNDLIDTFYVYGAVCSEDGHAAGMAVMSFKKTAIRAYKGWITRLRQFRIPNTNQAPPLYAHLTRITSLMKKNDKGIWYIPVMKSAHSGGIIPSLLEQNDERYNAAKMCRELTDAGKTRINPDAEAGGNTDADSEPF